MVDRSEMVRNTIESDFRTSKMSAADHFVQKNKIKKIRIDLKWPEMRSKVNFGHPKWAPAGISALPRYVNHIYSSGKACEVGGNRARWIPEFWKLGITGPVDKPNRYEKYYRPG